VFSVQGRKNFLRTDFRPELFKYMAGIMKNCGQYPLAVNGYCDHVHLFFELKPDNSVSEIIRIVKSNSSKWMNEQNFVDGKFNWQAGHGSFTYAKSQRDTVIKYLMNQEIHHQQKSFREEYLKMLVEYSIDYNNAYLFEFYDDVNDIFL